MEKSITINGKIVTGRVSRSTSLRQSDSDRKDHLKVWRDIYQDLRRQWDEAENCRTRNGRQ